MIPALNKRYVYSTQPQTLKSLFYFLLQAQKLEKLSTSSNTMAQTYLAQIGILPWMESWIGGVPKKAMKLILDHFYCQELSHQLTDDEYLDLIIWADYFGKFWNGSRQNVSEWIRNLTTVYESWDVVFFRNSFGFQ